MSPAVVARVSAALSARPEPEEPAVAPKPKPLPEWKAKERALKEALRPRVVSGFGFRGFRGVPARRQR